MEIDNVFLQCGESGIQQQKYAFILYILKVYTPFHILQYTFVGRTSSFQCIRGNVILTNKCFDNRVFSCDNLTFSSDTSSIVSEWNLVCDQSWLAKASMSVLMMGFLVGALILGSTADKIGRKNNILFTLLGMLFFNVVSALTYTYNIYLFSRFMIGFFVAGNVLSIVVLMSELVGPSYRSRYGLVIMGGFPVGIILLTLLASNIMSWRPLTFLVSLLGIPLLLSHCFLVESPRWLLSQGRQLEAEQVLTNIARGNKFMGKMSGTTEKLIVNSDTRLNQVWNFLTGF